MKTDKEYPATHSMMTSWFAIDAEGEVAIIEFGDDGPVPDFVGYKENSPSEVMFETLANDESNKIPYLPLTDEQIDVMLSYSKPEEGMYYSYDACYKVRNGGKEMQHKDIDLDGNPKYSALIKYLSSNEQLSFPIKIDANCSVPELKSLFDSLPEKVNEVTLDRYCLFDGIIEIDAAFEKEIIRIMSEHKDEFCLLSSQRHLYYMMCCNLSDYPTIKKHVKRHYKFYADGEKEMRYMPFYYYEQEWLSFPAIKKTSPIHPFSAKQLPESVVEKAIKLPIRFRDSKYFQFVKHYGFETWGTNFCFHTKDNSYYFPIKDETDCLLLYGTNHEHPISPIDVRGMLERGEIDWERISHSLYKLERDKGQVMYKSYKGDLVLPNIVWEELHKIFDQIAKRPL